MTEHTFRQLESLQRIDGLLRLARSRRFADPFEIGRLWRERIRLRDRLARV